LYSFFIAYEVDQRPAKAPPGAADAGAGQRTCHSTQGAAAERARGAPNQKPNRKQRGEARDLHPACAGHLGRKPNQIKLSHFKLTDLGKTASDYAVLQLHSENPQVSCPWLLNIKY
jgi:hypothetical protein